MEPIKIMLKKGDSMMSAFVNSAKKVDILNEIVNRGIVMAKAKKIDNLVDAMAISEKVLDKVSLYTCRYKVEGDDTEDVTYTITFGYSFPKDQYGSYIINFQFISSACSWADEMDAMAHAEAQDPDGDCPFTSCFEALIGMYVAKMICEALCIDDNIKPPTDRKDALKLAEDMMKELNRVRKVFDMEDGDDEFDKEVRKVYEHFKDSYVKVEPCGCLCDQDDDEDDDEIQDPAYEMVSEDCKWVHLPIIEGVDYTVENDDKEIRIYVDMANAADDAELVVGFPDDMDVVEKEIWDNRTLYVISKEA